MTDKFPDARLKIAVATEDHDLESGIRQLNPILRNILEGREGRTWTPGDVVSEKFGRLTFSQTK